MRSQTHTQTRAEPLRSSGRRGLLWEKSRNGRGPEKKEGEFLSKNVGNLPTSVTHLHPGASCLGQDKHGGLLCRERCVSLLPGRVNRRAAARLTNTKLVVSIFA